MTNKVRKLLDALRWGNLGRVRPDAPEDFEGFVLRSQAKEIVELPQVGQLTLHLLILSLHRLRWLFVGTKLVNAFCVFLRTASAHRTVAITFRLSFSAGNASTKCYGTLWFGRQDWSRLWLWCWFLIHGCWLQSSKIRHGVDTHQPMVYGRMRTMSGRRCSK